MAVFASGLNGLCEDIPDFREVVGTAAFVSCALLPGPWDDVHRGHLTGCQVISPAQTFSSPNCLSGRGPICLPRVLGVLPHKDCHSKISPPFAELFPCQLDLSSTRKCSSSLHWKHPTRSTLLRTITFFYTK